MNAVNTPGMIDNFMLFDEISRACAAADRDGMQPHIGARPGESSWCEAAMTDFR